MESVLNVYEFKARSKNQLMAIVCHFEMMNVDTKDIDIDDWAELTLRLYIKQNKRRCKDNVWVSVSPIFKKEKTYKSLNLDVCNVENCSSFERFLDVTKLINKHKDAQ